MITTVCLSLFGSARAQVPPEPVPAPAPAEPAPAPAPAPAPVAPVPAPVPVAPTPAPAGASVEQQLADLRAELAELKGVVDEQSTVVLGRQVEELRSLIESDEGRAVGNLTRMDDAKIRLAGYLDVGFFDSFGDGVAYQRDVGKQLFPQDAGVPWVFWGDPWANPINAQGDSADLGLDRTNLDRWDPIASGGRPSFIVNMVNQSVLVTFKKNLLLETSLNFEPRAGNELEPIGAPGDYLDVDLAYAEWVPFQKVNLHVFAGKFEPTFGIEYRARKASDRFGVTPSLIGRYITGSPTGLKLRGGLFDELVIYNVAVTNGQSSTERFAHFYNELDDNTGKTGSGRLSVVFPLPVFLEIGGSGMFGSQDDQPDDDVIHSQVGVDLKFRAGDFTLEGELMPFSRAEGGGTGDAPLLDAFGWYAQARYVLVPGFGVYGRVDRRKADLLADTNLYHSDTLRYTGGIRLDVTFNVLVKAEYLHVEEVDQPELDDDLFTSSLVLRY